MSEDDKYIINNRHAFFEYHIAEKYEAGIALLGTEVKSVMIGRIQLKESYVSIKDGEVWLFNAHISHYSHGKKIITNRFGQENFCSTERKLSGSKKR